MNTVAIGIASIVLGIVAIIVATHVIAWSFRQMDAEIQLGIARLGDLADRFERLADSMGK